MLRREGLYTSHLSAWRKQRNEGALKALSKARGRPKPNPLEADNARLRRRAERAEAELATNPYSWAHFKTLKYHWG